RRPSRNSAKATSTGVGGVVTSSESTSTPTTPAPPAGANHVPCARSTRRATVGRSVAQRPHVMGPGAALAVEPDLDAGRLTQPVQAVQHRVVLLPNLVGSSV